MYVNTNVAALNAWQNLDNTQNQLTTVLQQLSSGNRINSAADDPAGLAISQQMLTQIDGMQQAYTNSQSGISLLQTADGALNQIQNILQSMRSLASEAATSTNNSTDLQNLQTEMNQYASEITQITNTTQFNSVNLLGGAYTNQGIQIGANENQTLAVSLGAADAYTLGVTGQGATLSDPSNVTNGYQNVGANGLSPNVGYTLTAYSQAWFTSGWHQSDSSNTTSLAISTITGIYNGSTADSVTLTIYTSNTTTSDVYYTDGSHNLTQLGTTNMATGSTFTLDGVTFTLGGGSTLMAGDTYTINLTFNPASNSATLTGNGTTLTTTSNISGPLSTGETVQLSANGSAFSFEAGTGYVSQSTLGSATYNPTSTISLGSATYGGTGYGSSTGTATLTATVTITNNGGSAASSYTNGTGNATATTGISILTQGDAESALTIIDNAINNVSNERANVGAYQNRLQFAASDLQTSQQNLQAARAGITEADMALSMANLTRDQILQQSGVAMLAQANAMPQALLKLLP
jgi:flagellin